MDEDLTLLTAQCLERCQKCYRLIRIGETYHRTARSKVLCTECADKRPDFEVCDTIAVSDDLSVEVGDDRLRVRRGQAGITVNPGEVQLLVVALTEGEARIVGDQVQE